MTSRRRCFNLSLTTRRKHEESLPNRETSLTAHVTAALTISFVVVLPAVLMLMTTELYGGVIYVTCTSLREG